VAEVIFYLLFASFVVGMSWLVVGIVAGIRRRRKSRHLERGLAEYLREKAKPKGN